MNSERNFNNKDSIIGIATIEGIQMLPIMLRRTHIVIQYSKKNKWLKNITFVLWKKLVI